MQTVGNIWLPIIFTAPKSAAL